MRKKWAIALKLGLSLLVTVNIGGANLSPGAKAGEVTSSPSLLKSLQLNPGPSWMGVSSEESPSGEEATPIQAAKRLLALPDPRKLRQAQPTAQDIHKFKTSLMTVIEYNLEWLLVLKTASTITASKWPKNHFGLNWLVALIYQESKFDPTARSKSNALGLMQLKKETSLEMGIRDPYHPTSNLVAGVTYLKQALPNYLISSFPGLEGLKSSDEHRRFLTIVAYNAGPRGVAVQTKPLLEEVCKTVASLSNYPKLQAKLRAKFDLKSEYCEKKVPSPLLAIYAFFLQSNLETSTYPLRIAAYANAAKEVLQEKQVEARLQELEAHSTRDNEEEAPPLDEPLLI